MKKLVLATAVTASLMSFGNTNDTVDVRLLEKRIERIERKFNLRGFPTKQMLYDSLCVVTNYFVNLQPKKRVSGGFITTSDKVHRLYRSDVLNRKTRRSFRPFPNPPKEPHLVQYIDWGYPICEDRFEFSEEEENFENAIRTIEEAGLPEIREITEIDPRIPLVGIPTQTEYADRVMSVVKRRRPLTSD